jgi:hypothetical protein
MARESSVSSINLFLNTCQYKLLNLKYELLITRATVGSHRKIKILKRKRNWNINSSLKINFFKNKSHQLFRNLKYSFNKLWHQAKTKINRINQQNVAKLGKRIIFALFGVIIF